MTLEQLLVLAVLVLAPLLNLLVRALRRRLEIRAPRESGPEATTVPAPARTLPAALVAPRREPRGILPSAQATTLAPARRRRPRVRVGSLREARRAIALIAILGQCRGLEPPSLVRRSGARNA